MFAQIVSYSVVCCVRSFLSGFYNYRICAKNTNSNMDFKSSGGEELWQYNTLMGYKWIDISVSGDLILSVCVLVGTI